MKKIQKEAIMGRKLANFFYLFRDVFKEYFDKNKDISKEDINYLDDYLYLTLHVYKDNGNPSDLEKEFEDFFRGYRNEVGEFIQDHHILCPRCGSPISSHRDKYCRSCGCRLRKSEKIEDTQEDLPDNYLFAAEHISDSFQRYEEERRSYYARQNSVNDNLPDPFAWMFETREYSVPNIEWRYLDNISSNGNIEERG